VKKIERDNVDTSSVYYKGGDKYDDDEKIEVIIFLPMRKDFNSLTNRKKWITSLDGDVCFSKSMLSAN
jgi:hypothetical protein